MSTHNSATGVFVVHPYSGGKDHSEYRIVQSALMESGSLQQTQPSRSMCLTLCLTKRTTVSHFRAILHLSPSAKTQSI